MRRFAVLALFAAILAIYGCGSNSPEPPAPNVENGTDTPPNGDGKAEEPTAPAPEAPAASDAMVVYARGSDSVLLDPAGVEDGESVKVINNIYETLVTYPADSTEIIPQLAESWSANEDGSAWTFTLRQGVSFHDGTPLNAEAVKFSIERHLGDEPSSGYSATYRNIKSIQANDDLTVVFTLEGPSATFLRNLAMFPAAIVSPAAVKKDGDGFGRTSAVGTGPYTFSSWIENDRLILQRNDAYWGTPARNAGVVFVPVSDNGVRVERFLNGEFHIIDGIPFSELAAIKNDPNADLLQTQGMNLCYLAMNCEKTPFDNVRVRQAISLVVDLEAVRRLAYDGHGTLGASPVPPAVPFHSPRTVKPRNIEEAKKLLETCGRGDGFEAKLYCPTNPRPYMPDPQALGQVIKSQLAEIGIDVTIVSPEWGKFLQDVKSGVHDMVILGWSTDNGDPDNFLGELLHSDKTTKGEAQNLAFFDNPIFDKLVEAGRTTIKDEDRADIYREAQDVIHNSVPMLPLMHTDVVAAARSNVSGYKVHAIGLYRMDPVVISD